MGSGTDALPEDMVGETAVDLEEGPPRTMSGLEELDQRRRRGARVRQLLMGMFTALVALSIPAHVLEVSYPDGTTGLRIYGGAFVDEFQAAAMGRLLHANDLGDVRLTERRGRLPQ